MNETVALSDNTASLNEKVKFLSQPSTYPLATYVEVIETHMSWVFITDSFVYKLKKPVCYSFLDFRRIAARHKCCKEEVAINKPLAGDVYVGIIPLKLFHGLLHLDGKGETVDWLVKMKLLPKEQMLDAAIKSHTVRNDRVQQVAEKLVNFYLSSVSFKPHPPFYRKRIIKDIEGISADLLGCGFDLHPSRIIDITADLFHFIMKHATIFDKRIAEGRIIDTHGDLRPEHICLAAHPVIIDRLEFNKNLRIMDVAEELSFLTMECDMLASSRTGQLFLNVYRWKSNDKIPEQLILFYKAKRAFLRARLSINHLLEEKYLKEKQKWLDQCDSYLKAAEAYCEQLSKSVK